MATMQSKCKKPKNSEGSNTDRLSEMPDEVLVHILSFLSTLDAVRTMLLRRFGNLWTLVPVLEFDLDDYTDGMIRLDRYDDLWSVSPLNGSELQEYYENQMDGSGYIFWVFPRFSKFVRNVLRLHRGPTIDTFQILIDKFEDDLYVQDVVDDVHMWLKFAIDRGVKYLDFDFTSYVDTLPSCVFTSQSLVTVSLSEFKLEDQPRFHLGSVRKLSLFRARGNDHAFERLISGCSSLEELFIYRAKGLQRLDISNPSVIKLFICVRRNPVTLNCPALRTLDIEYSKASPLYLLEVIDVSSLKEVNVTAQPCNADLVMALVTQYRNVEAFTLLKHAFSQLSSMKINYPQNRWKRLVLHVCWNNERFFQVIVKLLTASVELEDLKINGESSWQGTGKKILLSPDASACVMPRLKTVTIHCNEKAFGAQLTLVQFLLENAIVLEKLAISMERKQLTVVEEYNFVKRVSMFKKASTNATVVFV